LTGDRHGRTMTIELWILAAFLVLVGVLVLVIVVSSLIKFFTAIMAAIFVLMFTGSGLLAGAAFLVVAIIVAVARLAKHYLRP